MSPDRGPVRVAAAAIIRTHQRRHPGSEGCCCAWRPPAGDPGWAHHVAAQLDEAGLLATTPATVGGRRG